MAKEKPEVIDLMQSGDVIGALRVAAKLRGMGEYRDRIARGWAAHQHPETYREMGYDPESLVADGIEAIRERFDIKG